MLPASPRFVVTMASVQYSMRLQNHLKIRSLVDRTLYVSDYGPTYSKGDCYLDIADGLGLTPEQICVIGDNMLIDIAPALDRGFKAIHVGMMENSEARCACVAEFSAVKAVQ
jgi:FMN phosphatase YigB (HAD superfamily)